VTKPDSSPKTEATAAPETRAVMALSWQIAADLVQRHPEFVVHEMHPGGGQYDVLAVFSIPLENSPMTVMLNRAGTIQVHSNKATRAESNAVVLGTWTDAALPGGAQRITRKIEDTTTFTTTRANVATPTHALAYRFIADALAVAAHDQHDWDARNEFIDSSGDWYLGDPELNGYVDAFPRVRHDFSETPRIGLWHEPESHFWAILRDEMPVAIVSLEGRVYRADHTYDLAVEYASGPVGAGDVAGRIFGDYISGPDSPTLSNTAPNTTGMPATDKPQSD
jgi:hypothetical protein